MAGRMKIAGPFLGKDRKPGDIISDEELSLVTQQTKEALVSQGIMEIEGFASGAATTMDAATKELIGQMLAGFDRFRETMTAEVSSLHKKIDALGGKTAKRSK